MSKNPVYLRMRVWREFNGPGPAELIVEGMTEQYATFNEFRRAAGDDLLRSLYDFMADRWGICPGREKEREEIKRLLARERQLRGEVGL